MAQLRIDRLRKVTGRVVAEYSHAAATVGGQAQGYGCAFESLQDLLQQVRQLRDFLRQPEQLFLLAILAALEADPTLPTPATLQGRVISFDSTSSTSPIVVS